MQTSNAKKSYSSDDPAWVLIAELSLRDILLDPDQGDERTTGFLFQAVRELDMSPECLENITWTVREFAREVSTHTKQGTLEFAGRIRILCQKKRIGRESPVKHSRYPEQDKQQRQVFHNFGVSRIGGWGYFMVKRCEDLQPDSLAISGSYIDLYLYKEGESYG